MMMKTLTASIAMLVTNSLGSVNYVYETRTPSELIAMVDRVPFEA